MVLEDLYIEDIAFGGKGIAKVPTENGDFVIFVANSLPGQRVKARIIKKKKRFAEAKLLRVQQRSPDEIDLPYQSIPGAPFAAWPIEKQEAHKKSATLEMFKRIGEQENIDEIFDEFISSPKHWHYRNKMEYSFSTLISDVETAEETEGFALGFKRRGQWWAVENLEAPSGLFDAQFEAYLSTIRQFCEASGLPPWNPAKSNGFFRFLVVRKSFEQDQLLVNLVTTSEGLDQFDAAAFTKLMGKEFGERLAGLQHTVNDDIGDAAKQPPEQVNLLYGRDKITETILGLEFEISMQSFFQTNPGSAEQLYLKAIDYVKEALVEIEGDDLVAMDLFCGTGTIAQLLRSQAEIQQVIGVDIVKEAIEDARANSLRNGVEDIQFFAADVRRFLKEYPQYQGKIGVVVLDPPRGGIVPKALQRVIELDAPAIVYISCNPSTQARDSLVLKEAGYQLTKMSLVDQFPHTSHIESVALYRKH